MSVKTGVRSVSYSGLRAGSGPLAWGQRDIWNKIGNLGELGSRFNLVCAVDVPDGTAVESLLAAVVGMVERHESLRTRFSVGPDGEPRQELSADGEIPVGVRTLERVDTAAVATACAEMQGQSIELDDVPLRVEILTDGTAPRSLIVCVSHLLCDGVGLAVLRRELSDFLSSGAFPRDDGAARPQPLDRAAFEQSPAGRRVNEQALAYWRSQVERYPARLFPPPSHTESVPRYRSGVVRSPVISAVPKLTARRHRVSPNAVGVAVWALLIGLLAESDRSVLHLICANRARPGDRQAVEQLAQCVPIVIDLDHGSFAELFRDVHRQCIKAYSHAMYCPVQAGRVVTDLAPPGTHPDRSRCLVNPLFGVFDPSPGGADLPPDGADASLPAMAASATVEWSGGTSRDDVTGFVRLGPNDEALLQADTRVFPPDLIEQALRAAPELLVAGYRDDTPPADAARRALTG
ncbi:condensation domain-containing protein [Streptomyces sp. B6B3]|uniref:condensation domain-containing protein n=1 Tax=Streptomyces sp. B6B3 TaxID=3153570 RepID=UPI00325EC3A4